MQDSGLGAKHAAESLYFSALVVVKANIGAAVAPHYAEAGLGLRSIRRRTASIGDAAETGDGGSATADIGSAAGYGD